MCTTALVNPIFDFSFILLCRNLLTAFQAFCECVGDLEMGKVDKFFKLLHFRDVRYGLGSEAI